MEPKLYFDYRKKLLNSQIQTLSKKLSVSEDHSGCC